MKISKVLEKALEWFGPKGEKWIQGKFYVRDPQSKPCKACAIGAIRLVNGGSGCSKAESWFQEFVTDRTIYTGAIAWNDRKGRRFVTIRSMFKKAIAKAKKEEAAA